MAVWQFTFDLVPERALDELRRSDTQVFVDYDRIPANSPEEAEQFLKDAGKVLEPTSSLSELIRIWGSEDGITLQHRSASGSISVRIHAGNYSAALR